MERNPYIGPRPYDRGDTRKLYGREREARDLEALITAEREVLCYAQSGAGKTSLFNARIIPALERKGFVVLPVTRVGAGLPPGIAPGQVQNIFVFSALLSLSGDQADPAALALQTFCAGIKARLAELELLSQAEAAQEPVRPPILIFDQFEELFTTHRDRWQEARDFFIQVRQALDEIPELGMVFSMREDYLAALDPYLGCFATRLRARFRLELLGEAGALEAVTGPAGEAGVAFVHEVAGQLVDNLRRMKVQGLGEPEQNGSEQPVLGPVVEPVQLQVVCSQLWANLPAGTTAIHLDDLQQYGNVDRALKDFYETTVRSAAKAGGLPERVVRRWFGQQLITPAGRRGLAMQGSDETAGLPNSAVRVLEDLHIIRAEARAGTRWYEISHDRLVEPILASNRAWEQARETPLRAAARRWQDTGDAALLYRGRALAEAGRQVALFQSGQDSAVDLEPYELEFYQTSRKAERTARIRRAMLAGGLALALIIAGVMAFLAQQASFSAVQARNSEATAVAAGRRAEEQRVVAVTAEAQAQEQKAAAEQERTRADDLRVVAQQQEYLARSRELASQARNALDREEPQLSLLLALQSLPLSLRGGEARSQAGEQMLRDVLGQTSGIPLQGHTLMVNGVYASPDGNRLATPSDDGDIRLWDLTAADPGQASTVLSGHSGWVTGVAYSPEGRWLATSGQDKIVRLWDLSAADPAKTPQPLEGHTGLVQGLAFSKDGGWLFTGSADKTVRQWKIDSAGAVFQAELTGPSSSVTQLVISGDDRWLAGGIKDGSIWLWDLQAADPAKSARHFAMQGRVYGLTFSPNSRWLAGAGVDRRVVLWDMQAADPGKAPLELGQHLGTVHDLAFSPDGCWLASAGSDRKVYLWYMGPGTAGAGSAGEKPGSVFYALTGHTGEVEAVAFPQLSGPLESYQTLQLASGGLDHTVRLWDLSPVAVQAKGCRRASAGQPASAAAAAMPDGRMTELSSLVLRGLDGEVTQVAFATQNHWLAASGADGSARLWDLSRVSASNEPYLYNTAGVGDVMAGEISQDGRWVAAAGTKGVFAWPLASADEPPRLIGCPEKGAYTVKAGPLTQSGSLLAAGCYDSSVLLWNTADPSAAAGAGKAFKPTLLAGLSEQVLAIAFSPDGQWLAAGDYNGLLLAWRLEGGAPKGDPVKLMDDGGSIYSLVFDPRGRWLASGDAKGRLMIWDLANPKAPLASFAASKAGIFAVDASPDGRWLAGAALDQNGVVHLWDMASFSSGENPPEFILGGFTNSIYAVKFSPDGHWLAAGGNDYTLRLWDITRLAQLEAAKTPQPDPQEFSAQLKDHESAVYFIAFSPDSRWLLSGSTDSTLRQWDTANPRQLPVKFSGHTATVRTVAVTPDGLYDISASPDGTLRRWTLSLEGLVNAACAQVRRSLRPEETRRYMNGLEPAPVCP